MSGALPASPRLRLVSDAHSPVTARKVATTLALQADWSRMLGDVTTLGQLNVEVANTAARLRCAAEPWSAHLDGESASLTGPGMALLALTDRWGFANIARSAGGERYRHLDVCDHAGERLLRLSLTEESAWQGFSALVVSQWARRATPSLLPDHTDLAQSLRRLEQHAELTFCGALHDEWFDADRQHYAGVAVDPSLLAPFLETLSHQECPLRIRLGNAGLLVQHEAGFFDCRQSGGTLRLRSATATLELDAARLAVARSVASPKEPAGRWLRLYDDDCRCVLVIGLGSRAESDDASLWQGMLRALRE
jgi:putative heme degradation protein